MMSLGGPAGWPHRHGAPQPGVMSRAELAAPGSACQLCAFMAVCECVCEVYTCELVLMREGMEHMSLRMISGCVSVCVEVRWSR